MTRPYQERILSENVMLRKFSQRVQPSQLVWHRDRENRIIEVLSGKGWLFQRDNKLPIVLKEGDRIKVKAGEYHRLIKGDKNLYVKIFKESKQDEGGFSYAAAKAAVSGEKEFSFGGKKHPVKMSKAKAKKILDELEKNLDEKASDNPQYAAGRSGKNKKGFDAAVKAYNKAKKTQVPNF